VDFHAIIETPGGISILNSAIFPTESFARSDRERKLVSLQRAFRIAGTPLLPPGTPKDRVEILRRLFANL
jgi:hypothetical protein